MLVLLNCLRHEVVASIMLRGCLAAREPPSVANAERKGPIIWIAMRCAQFATFL